MPPGDFNSMYLVVGLVIFDLFSALKCNFSFIVVPFWVSVNMKYEDVMVLYK